MTWILVLMLMATPTDARTGSMVTIPGYRSEAACLAAAGGWVEARARRRPFYFGAACIAGPVE